MNVTKCIGTFRFGKGVSEQGRVYYKGIVRYIIQNILAIPNMGTVLQGFPICTLSKLDSNKEKTVR